MLIMTDAEFGLGIEVVKLSTENGNDCDIVIQKVTSTENAQHVQ